MSKLILLRGATPSPALFCYAKPWVRTPTGYGQIKTTTTRVVILIWLGIGDGNITFDDELNFDASEIEKVFDDPEEAE